MVYVGGGSANTILDAYSANGTTNCSGVPKVCSPIWTGSPDTSDTSATGTSSPAVENGVVYIATLHALYAFDSSGKTNCSGTPTVCHELWSAVAATNSSNSGSTPAVAGGTVFITNASSPATGAGILYAFDAAGSTNCSGTPKVCSPLWTTSTGSTVAGSPAIANGTLYIDGGNVIDTFDATGVKGCAGTPKVCTRLWSSTAPNFESGGFPAVANGVLYEGSFSGGPGNGLYVWDATGSSNCSGTPKVCSPLLSYPLSAFVWSDPAVANGIVYLADGDAFNSQHELFALQLPSAPG